MLCYKWIDVECVVSNEKDEMFRSNYLICMNQQDFDVPANAFPVAVTKSQRKTYAKSREVDPWGLTEDEIGVDKIPKMDMAEEGYDPEALGHFFNKLIKADIKRKIEESF